MERRHTNEPFSLVNKPPRYATFDAKRPALIDTIETKDGVAGHLVTQEDPTALQFYSWVGPEDTTSYALKLKINATIRELYAEGTNVKQARSAILAEVGEQWTNTAYGPPEDYLEINTY